MSTNWKDIGKNSGNMQNHRNVSSNKLNYENGKWDSIYEVSGVEMKPFSRLSLGSSDKNGTFDSTKPGQLSAIALNEKPNGANFNGLFYNTDISGQNKNAGLIPGLQIMSSTTDFSLTSFFFFKYFP